MKADVSLFLIETMKPITTIAILLLTAFVAAAPTCKKERIPDAIKAVAKLPPGTVPAATGVTRFTAKGVEFMSNREPGGGVLQMIDYGIEALNTAASTDGFRQTKGHGFYWITTPPFDCIPSPEGRVPSFLVNGGTAYDGTIYDQFNPKGRGVKDGISVIYASEMVLSVGTPGSIPERGFLYVCPDASHLEDAVRNGAEHIHLANYPYNEINRTRGPYDGYSYYWATMIHGPPHPLLPRPAGVVAKNQDAPKDVMITTAFAGHEFFQGRVTKAER